MIAEGMDVASVVEASERRYFSEGVLQTKPHVVEGLLNLVLQAASTSTSTSSVAKATLYTKTRNRQRVPGGCCGAL